MVGQIVAAGRLVGLAIIAVGVGLAFWNVTDIDYASTSDQVRFFLNQVLNFVAFGSLVYLGAEILDQLLLRNMNLKQLDEPEEHV